MKRVFFHAAAACGLAWISIAELLTLNLWLGVTTALGALYALANSVDLFLVLFPRVPAASPPADSDPTTSATGTALVATRPEAA